MIQKQQSMILSSYMKIYDLVAQKDKYVKTN